MIHHTNTFSQDRLDGLDYEQQAELLHSLIDSAPDAIIAHEPDGTLVFFSRGACNLLKYSPEQMRDLKPFGWVGPDSMRGGPARLESILHEGQLTFRSTAVTGDGRIIPTEVAARRLDTEKGPLIVAVIRDSAERHEDAELWKLWEPSIGLEDRE